MCSASQEIRVTRFAQPTINPLACCICWTGLLGRAVFHPWNEGPNFASYTCILAWEIPWTEEPDRLYRPWGHKESDTTEHTHMIMAMNITQYMANYRLLKWKLGPAHCSLYFLCSQERERKTHFSFSLFTAQSGDKNHVRQRWLLVSDPIHNLKLMRPKEIEVDQA